MIMMAGTLLIAIGNGVLEAYVWMVADGKRERAQTLVVTIYAEILCMLGTLIILLLRCV